ncbi:SDR family oxidoreductase [Streptomyces sp. L7]
MAGFGKSLADELEPARHPRRRAAAAPASTRTACASWTASPRTRKPPRRANETRIPLRRYGTPDEFGRVAAFLLSPAASYLTGIMVPVDGGMRHGF